MSALVEVNVGIFFRHRIMFLTPLIFIYVRLLQLASINRDDLSRKEDSRQKLVAWAGIEPAT